HYTDENGVICFTNISSPGADRRASVFRETGENRYHDAIARYGDQYGVDAKLIAAIVRCESNFDPNAVSPKGAQGLMQLMPDTARQVKVDDPFDPLQNLDGGIRHFRNLLKTFGDTRLALAAYNAGANAVRKYNGMPPFTETRDYVDTIMSLYHGQGQPSAVAAPARQEGVHIFINKDGTRVFTNLPRQYQSDSRWRRLEAR
ncbi:MAG: hypothetical protein COZ12_07950, partial [Deltaproteobacteria bacterium CG_4_10_14_3_um_filter_60_8]